jgi:hypothetical protein
MKLACLVAIVALALTALPARSAPYLEQFGKVELSAGGEKEARTASGGRLR